MVRAVLLGCLTALLVATLSWYGWLDPRARADGEVNFYPPVAIPATAALNADDVPGNAQATTVALRLAPAAAGGRHAAPTPVPTVELLPDLRIRAPSDLALIGSRAAGTLRLKFTTTIWNDGLGPVEVRGSQHIDAELRVIQYVHRANAEPLPSQAVGSFDFDHRHGHLHLAGFARYDLWSLNQAGEPVEIVAHNAKVGFCLMDNTPIDEQRAPDEPVYENCNAEVQGISVGYGDAYVAALYEQDLNVTHLLTGRYRLVNTANPEHEVRELDYANNSAHVDIVLNGDHVALAH